MIGQLGGFFEYLISPEQLIAMPIFEAVPGIEKLGNPVAANMIGVLAALVPGERGPNVKQAHSWREMAQDDGAKGPSVVTRGSRSYIMYCVLPL